MRISSFCFSPAAMLDDRHVSSGTLEGHRRSRKASSAGDLVASSRRSPGRRVRPADDQVLRRGQRRHQREVLVDHADAMGVGGHARIVDLNLVVVDHHLAARRLVEAHDALDQRRLAGAVLAEQGMQRCRACTLMETLSSAVSEPKTLVMPTVFEADGAVLLRRGRMGGRVVSGAHGSSLRLSPGPAVRPSPFRRGKSHASQPMFMAAPRSARRRWRPHRRRRPAS